MVGPENEQGLYECEIRVMEPPTEFTAVTSEDRGNLLASKDWSFQYGRLTEIDEIHVRNTGRCPKG